MDPKVVALYDEYTHAPLPRRTFLERLAKLGLPYPTPVPKHKKL